MTSAVVARTGHPLRAALRSVKVAPYRAATIALAALAADRVFDPDHTHVPFCPLHAVTGIWCPFCGGLRSAYELTRLHVGTAIHDNVVLVATLPVIVALWLDWAMRARHGDKRRSLPRVATIAIVVVAVLFTIVRNLPFAAALRPVN
jgi:hypothetical protein